MPVSVNILRCSKFTSYQQFTSRVHTSLTPSWSYPTRITLRDQEPGHWRSLLLQDCIWQAASRLSNVSSISGLQSTHPLTWNVSWAGDNLRGFLLSHHKNPSEGQFCHRRPAHICKADSELQITKKPPLRDAFHFHLAWDGLSPGPCEVLLISATLRR